MLASVRISALSEAEIGLTVKILKFESFFGLAHSLTIQLKYQKFNVNGLFQLLFNTRNSLLFGDMKC